MKKLIVFTLLIVSCIGYSQRDSTDVYQRPKFWDNVRFGGGLGLSFGRDITVINISPSAIYDFQNNFAMGIGLGYLYSKNGDLRSNVISPGVLALYNPAQEVQLSAEFEQLFINQDFGSDSRSFDYPALYLGVAYRTGWASFGVRYDVLFDERDSIFASAWSPIIRVYF
ncbi:MAG: hypothetical protein QNJ57_02055 [Flavobacteriaceae bacterium]|nr:hypothetical protein [Flavobacteriaceae bacterium]